MNERSAILYMRIIGKILWALVVGAVLAVGMLQLRQSMRPKGHLNKGSSLLAIKSGLTALENFKRENGVYPFHGQKIAVLEEYGLDAESVTLLSLLITTSEKLDDRTIVLVSRLPTKKSMNTNLAATLG